MPISRANLRRLGLVAAAVVVGISCIALLSSPDREREADQRGPISGVSDISNLENLPPAIAGELPIDGSPTYGPVPVDRDGDGRVSGTGEEELPDFVPIVLDNGEIGYVDREVLDAGFELPETSGDQVLSDLSKVKPIILDGFDKRGHKIGILTLELFVGENPKTGVAEGP